MGKSKEYYALIILVIAMMISISYILLNSNPDRKMDKCDQIEELSSKVNCIAKVLQKHPEGYSN